MVFPVVRKMATWTSFPAFNSRLCLFTLQLGLICGFVSSDVIKLYKTKLQLQRKRSSISLDTYYRFLIIIIYAMFILDYFISVWSTISSLKLSGFILESTAAILLFVTDISKRIYWLRNQEILLQIFTKLLITNNGQQSQFTNSGKPWKMRDSLITWTIISFTLRFSKSIVDLVFAFNPKDTIGFGLFFTTNNIIQRLITIFSHLYDTFCSFGSRAVTRTIVVLIGINLFDKYNELVNEFLSKISNYPEKCANDSGQTQINTLKSNDNNNDTTKNWNLQNFANRFHNLQQCFNLFNSFSGFLILFAFIDSVGSIIFNLYNTQNMFLERNYWRAFTGCIVCIEHIMSVYVYVLLGELSYDLMQKSKLEIRTAVLKKMLGKSKNTLQSIDQREQLIAISNSILNWEWNLSAANLFTINFQLLPKIVGTILTYVMFMFQLIISEETSLCNSNSNPKTITTSVCNCTIGKSEN